MPKSVKEKVIEDYLIRRVEAMGGTLRKVKWLGRDKAPDRFVMLPVQITGERRSCWVELKRPGGKAKFPGNAHERGQAYEHEIMRAFGERVFVVDSLDGVEELLS